MVQACSFGTYNGVHCFAHKTNLVMQSLSHLPFIKCIENLLQSLHGYLKKLPKHHLEFAKLVELIKTKGNIFVRNTKTNRIPSPSCQNVSWYFLSWHIVGSNLTLLLNMESLLGLACVIVVFECVHSLINYAQLCDVFMVAPWFWGIWPPKFKVQGDNACQSSKCNASHFQVQPSNVVVV